MGFEPMLPYTNTNGLANRPLQPLEYFSTPDMERMMRIELTPSAWKAEVLPLNYIRIIGAEDEIRTRDPRLGKAMLYP